MKRSQPLEMWTVESGEYSDHRVLCVCRTKKQAQEIVDALNANKSGWSDAFIGTLPVATGVNYVTNGCHVMTWPLAAPWMIAAADQIATAIIQHTTLDQTRHIALLIELGVTSDA